MTRKQKERKRRNAEIQRATEELLGIRRELRQSENLFNHMTDPNKMDACIFEMNALKARYNCAVIEVKRTLPPSSQ